MTFPTSPLTKSRGRITSAWLAFFEAALPNEGRLWNFRNVSTSTTVALRDFCEADASGGTVTLTLPDPTLHAGEMCGASKGDSSENPVVLLGTVNGIVDPSFATRHTAVMLVSTGTEWRVV